MFRSINRYLQHRNYSHYITTPVFYVNSAPHIGHVHTLLLADASNLYQQLKQNRTDTIFSTGTDEHGIKIQTAAEAKGIKPSIFCELNQRKFLNLFNEYETSLTYFLRTSEYKHIDAVQTFWKKLYDNGFIYKSTYSGWYSTTDEAFLPKSQVSQIEVDNQIHHVDQNNNKLVWSSEENYMFKLSDIGDQIFCWLSQKKPIIPQKFNDEALGMLKSTSLEDLSISRPKKRLYWGIDVPGDTSQTIYVWLDALVNYLTVIGYPCDTSELKRWPIDCQIFGKDILKFHAIYWPAFLIALSLDLPKKLVCHSHWMVDSYKMSKSRGNVVDPLEENQIFTKDGLRYYLLRAGTPAYDADYSRLQAYRRINAELADNYGNLMSRCCSKTINPNQVIPNRIDKSGSGINELKDLIQNLNELPDKCDEFYDRCEFYKGVDEIMTTLRLSNSLYQRFAPWKLVKTLKQDEKSLVDYINIQSITFESLRVCSILLQPIVPKICARALTRINANEKSWCNAKLNLTDEQRSINSAESSALFSRLKIPSLES